MLTTSLQCPSCDAHLTRREAGDGWCEACGKQLPPAVTAAAARRSRPDAQPGDLFAVLGKCLTWIGVVGFVLCLVAVPLLLTGSLLPMGHLPDDQQDRAVGKIAVGLVSTAFGFASLIGVGRWLRN